MSSSTSDTRWLNLLKAGNRDAAQALWERYFHLIVARARQGLGASPRRAADEEDVALSAFDSFCRGVEMGRFPQMEDRNDLRGVLLMVVARKAAHQIRDECCEKRGGKSNLKDEEMLSQLIDSEPTPELALQFAEECSRLLDKLNDPDLRATASWLVEGFSVEEIASKLGRAPATVYRKLALIRDLWSEERPTP